MAGTKNSNNVKFAKDTCVAIGYIAMVSEKCFLLTLCKPSVSDYLLNVSGTDRITSRLQQTLLSTDWDRKFKVHQVLPLSIQLARLNPEIQRFFH